jgi:hypothetical protein
MYVDDNDDPIAMYVDSMNHPVIFFSFPAFDDDENKQHLDRLRFVMTVFMSPFPRRDGAL